MRGILVAICGLDGSGKTTQIGKLNDWFEKENKPHLLTRQPSDYYRQDERVRNYLDNGVCPDMNALALLAAADRRWHLATLVEPSIKEGISVITDRYLYSSLAYFKFRGLETDYVKYLNGEIRIPDVTVFLDLDPEITLNRIIKRDGKLVKYEERDSSMFKKIRLFFKEVLPEDALIIDGTLDSEQIHKTIVEEINRKIKNIEEGEYVGN